MARTGRCLCGQLGFEAAGEPAWVAYCHCGSCRRHTGAPLTCFANFPAAAVRFTGERAAWRSSPGVTRSHCARCGTSIAYETEARPGEIDLYVAAFDDPAGLPPQLHVHVRERLPWLDTRDRLPRASGGGEDLAARPSGLAGFIIDCRTDDLAAAARFWGAALRMPLVELPGEEGQSYVRLANPDYHVEVQKVAHPSRVHLDIDAEDVEAEVQRLESLGAVRVAAVQRWVVMEAPTGQRFCVVPRDPPPGAQG